MKNNISDFLHCANCGACYNVCPRDAISVKNDFFYKLTVDEEKCINCGRCVEVCPVNQPRSEQKLYRAYAGIHADEAIVGQSSSGGAFSAFAEEIMRRGGVVFAAAFDQEHVVRFFSSDDVSLDSLRRSKYVESLVGESFRAVKKELEGGREVLFCGAPCQVAGLKRYLGKEYEGLLTLDFSCGGMPSHVLFSNYLRLVEKQLRSPVTSINFRPKLYGWERHAIRITGANGKKYRKMASADPYFSAFIGKRYIVRDYCHECDFSNNHYADIILADFWLYRKASHISHDDKGLSLVITNSPKGDAMLDSVRQSFPTTLLDLSLAAYNIKEKHVSEDFWAKRAIALAEYQTEAITKVSSRYGMKSQVGLKARYYCHCILQKVRNICHRLGV